MCRATSEKSSSQRDRGILEQTAGPRLVVAQLLLRLLALGDVVERGEDLIRLATIGSHMQYGVDLDPAIRVALRVPDPHHHIAHCLTRSQCDHARVFLAGEVRPILVDRSPASIHRGPTLHLIEAQSEDALGGGIGGDDLTVARLEHQTLCHGLEQPAVLALALTQILLGLPAIGDVVDDREDARLSLDLHGPR